MTGKVISIGNSLGMILPARILKELSLTKDSNLELRVENGKLIVSESSPHKGWAEDAKKLHALREDNMFEDSLDDMNGEWDW
ncbi:MAG: hypothetical protein KBT22_02715 [Bacteroidales bacterium]|nr:hypothetical protein [Candidatus Scybalocola fimicaballi]